MTRSAGNAPASRPSSTGGWPVAKTTAPGLIVARRVVDRLDLVAPDGDRGGRDAGADRGQPVGQADQRPQRVDPGLVPDQRAAEMPGKAGYQRRDLVASSHSTFFG